MKNILALLGILSLLGGGPVFAEMNVLSDGQLDLVVAGTFPDDNLGGQVNASQGISANGVETLNVNDNLNAQNLVNVNFAETVIENSASDSDRVNWLILKDGAQLNAKAMQIVNNVEGNVANAMNFNVGGFERELSTRGTGSFPSLIQSNVVNQKK